MLIFGMYKFILYHFGPYLPLVLQYSGLQWYRPIRDDL